MLLHSSLTTRRLTVAATLMLLLWSGGTVAVAAEVKTLDENNGDGNSGGSGTAYEPVCRSDFIHLKTVDGDFVPWQPPPSNDEVSRYEDTPPIVFSPTGRLHSVEAAVKASKAVTPLSNLLLAMR